jgi:hypothetical protein
MPLKANHAELEDVRKPEAFDLTLQAEDNPLEIDPGLAVL